MPSLQDIQRYCDAIAEAFRPQQIVLFGSHAYGTPSPDSDVDVLVVMKKADTRVCGILLVSPTGIEPVFRV